MWILITVVSVLLAVIIALGYMLFNLSMELDCAKNQANVSMRNYDELQEACATFDSIVWGYILNERERISKKGRMNKQELDDLAKGRSDFFTKYWGCL